MFEEDAKITGRLPRSSGSLKSPVFLMSCLKQCLFCRVEIGKAGSGFEAAASFSDYMLWMAWPHLHCVEKILKGCTVGTCQVDGFGFSCCRPFQLKFEFFIKELGSQNSES